jgi:hypothetical protein
MRVESPVSRTHLLGRLQASSPRPGGLPILSGWLMHMQNDAAVGGQPRRTFAGHRQDNVRRSRTAARHER